MISIPEVSLDRSKSTLSSEHIDYYAGDLNIILCAPHGGHKRPPTIPDRDAGSFMDGKIVFGHSEGMHKDFENLQVRTISDSNTIQLTLFVAKELNEELGKWPHVVVNQLYRGKMDANCDLEKATFNVSEAQEAWRSFHQCIDEAKRTIKGPGLFLDIHGHSQTAWIELGYKIMADALDTSTYNLSSSSVCSLARCLGDSSGNLISGSNSLGAFLQEEGFETVPSPRYPSPQGGHYYSGGYNTSRHGSREGGHIDAIQIECPAKTRSPQNIAQFAKALARAIGRFWREYYAR